MANKKGSHQLTRADRIKIEALLKEGLSKAKIAAHLGVHRSTIYNELKRGEYEHHNSDWTTEIRYSPDIAQEKAEENLKVRGTQLKIGNDIAYANYIEDKIVNEDYSPAAVLGELKAQGREGEFNTTVCVATLYSYIDKGVFLKLTNKDLPVKKNKKRGYKKVRKQQARAAAGDSIEKRPEEIDRREEFGHWEMDCVVGSTLPTLLVLTERLTRKEIIMRMPDRTANSVIRSLNSIERRYGVLFRKVFKSITVDNGAEFSDCKRLERSTYGGKRTNLYYCHPYSSCERGSNERINRDIRRLIPKGSNIAKFSKADIQAVENWVNAYPREMFGFATADEMYKAQIEKLQ